MKLKSPHYPALFGIVALLVIGTLSFAEDASKKASAPVLKSVSCAPECGFLCRSHNEKELIEIVKAHALSDHGKALTDEQVKSLIKAEVPSGR